MGTPVVNVSNFLSAVQSRLKNSAVGYSFVIGGAAIPATKFSAGSARTAANGQSFPFQSSTPSGVGSVSKFITAIAAVQLLDRPDAGGVEGWNILNATLDSPMYQGLPTYWDLRSDIQAITYRDLLTHTSGLAPESSPGEPGQDYFNLKTYLSPTPAPGTPPLGPRGSYAYSNVGFALLRLLLPNVVGLVPTTTPGQYEQDRAYQYATQFQAILNDNLWGQLGIVGPSQGTPAGADHAFMYVYPGSSPGNDWSQWQYPGQTWPGEGQPLIAGAGTCWVSIDQLTPVLDSINKIDQRLLTLAQWAHMQGIGVPAGYENYGMGIDRLTVSLGNNQYRWVEKNGGLGLFDSAGSGSLTASVAFFGSMESGANPDNGPFYAALFINSDISGAPGSENGWFRCTKCDSLFKPSNGNGNVCPANGKAHTQGGQYFLSTNQPGGQSNWRQCLKCAALCFEPSATDPSKCAAGGGRHAPTGNTFVLSQTGQGTLEIQANWRWCKNCGVLAFSGGNSSAGECAAGGPHQFILSDSNYAIQVLIGADTVLIEAFSESI
jgi:Beta-lactamase